MVKKKHLADIKYFILMNEVYTKDVNRCIKTFREKEKKFEKNKNEETSDELYFWYRCLIRAFFAYVEGITYIMRQNAIRAHKRNEVKYTIDEIVLLKEKTYYLVKNKIKSKNKWNSFEDNFKLTFMLCPRAFNAKFEPDKIDEEYKSIIKKAVDARNSITHPKSHELFIIPPPETFKDINNAIKWFNEKMRELIKEIRTAMNTQ